MEETEGDKTSTTGLILAAIILRLVIWNFKSVAFSYGKQGARE